MWVQRENHDVVQLAEDSGLPLAYEHGAFPNPRRGQAQGCPRWDLALELPLLIRAPLPDGTRLARASWGLHQGASGCTGLGAPAGLSSRPA